MYNYNSCKGNDYLCRNIRVPHPECFGNTPGSTTGMRYIGAVVAG